MIKQEEPVKPKRATGLLGRVGMKDRSNDEQTGQQEPIQRVAKIVKEMRQARMELRNGRE